MVNKLNRAIEQKEKEDKYKNKSFFSISYNEGELRDALDFLEKNNEDGTFDKDIKHVLKQLVYLNKDKLIDAQKNLEKYEKMLEEKQRKSPENNKEKGDKNEGISQI